MDDLGAPASYLVLEPGAPVYSSERERVGRVVEIRADTEKDIFDGLVIERGLLSGGRRYVAADRVDEIFDGGVLLTIDAAAVESLPEPR